VGCRPSAEHHCADLEEAIRRAIRWENAKVAIVMMPFGQTPCYLFLLTQLLLISQNLRVYNIAGMHDRYLYYGWSSDSSANAG
jgi:hypothetical protein